MRARECWAHVRFSRQTLHGGLILSLTDSLGSLAVATHGTFMTGVSTDIGTSFVRPAGVEGDTLLASATLISMGAPRITETPISADGKAYGQFAFVQGRRSHLPK